MSTDPASQFWDETPDAVFAVTATGEILSWNPAAESIFGYSREEAMGANLTALIVPSDRIDEESQVREAAVISGVTVYESVRRRKDGSLVHVNISSKAVGDKEGHLRFVLHTAKDVTHLKVLRDSRLVEAKFRDLLESTPDAIVMVNVTGRIVLVNSQAQAGIRLFARCTHRHASRKPAAGTLSESVTTAIARISSRCRATRTMGVGLEFYGLRRDGRVSGGDQPKPANTEEGTMVMSAVRDITDRKKAEQKFRGLLESAPDAMVIVGQRRTNSVSQHSSRGLSVINA